MTTGGKSGGSARVAEAADTALAAAGDETPAAGDGGVAAARGRGVWRAPLAVSGFGAGEKSC